MFSAMFGFGDIMLLADGFEKAFIGVAQQFNKHVACYDYEKCVRLLMKENGISEKEAVEYMDFNVTGAYVGEQTPVFLHKMSLKQCREMAELVDA
jgi:hypothetical protein